MRSWLRSAAIQCGVLLITLGATELALQWLNLHYLRLEDWSSLGYQHDAEIGWSPIPSSTIIVSQPRTITAQHNSLGLRDIEPGYDQRPAVLVLGDSFVWGHNVEADERFTDLLRLELPQYRIVNAGVSGYGTDQEYLLMRRVWDAVKPTIVVLTICVENDRADNSSNVRSLSYKPYLRMTAEGNWEFAGQPPPKQRRLQLKESGLARTFMLVRIAISAYVEIRYRRVTVPDPTERLIGMIREFVETGGARLAVGMTRDEAQLQTFLRGQGIPYVSFEGGQLYYDPSHHWTPEGHRLAAGRLLTLLTQVRSEASRAR